MRTREASTSRDSSPADSLDTFTIAHPSSGAASNDGRSGESTKQTPTASPTLTMADFADLTSIALCSSAQMVLTRIHLSMICMASERRLESILRWALTTAFCHFACASFERACFRMSRLKSRALPKKRFSDTLNPPCPILAAASSMEHSRSAAWERR